MADFTPAVLRLASELRWLAGHGYKVQNAQKYPNLMALPQISGRLPIDASTEEIAALIDNTLIDSIARFDHALKFRFSGQEVPTEELRGHWTQFLGLPPFSRTGRLEQNRNDVVEALAGGSVVNWRRKGGAEEEFVGHLADFLLRSAASVKAESWVVRRSYLHYFFNEQRTISKLSCRYDVEVLRDGARSFGIDHWSASRRAGVRATYEFCEGSIVGCDELTNKRLDDGSLSIDLNFKQPLKRGDRRTLGYDLAMVAKYSDIETLRLNAQILVWGHDLTVTFADDNLPERVWWFAHHIGVGAGQEPDVRDFDLEIVDNVVHQTFAGLSQGPDYGIALRWLERGKGGDTVTSLGT